MIHVCKYWVYDDKVESMHFILFTVKGFFYQCCTMKHVFIGYSVKNLFLKTYIYSKFNQFQFQISAHYKTRASFNMPLHEIDCAFM